MKHLLARLVAPFLAFAAFITPLPAHNLDTTATSIAFAKDFLQTISTRAAASQPLIQQNDEFWVIIKTTAGPGTLTGVGGYQTFYPPAGMRVVDAAYVFPQSSDPRGFRNIPMKGQSPIAIGNGSIAQSSTPAFVGWSLPGTNGLNFSTAPVTAAGKDRGTLAGVYADTGIFFSTDPRTAFNSYGGSTMTNNSGDTVGEFYAANVPNSTTRRILGVMTLWDSYQLRAYGRKDITPLLDSIDGRGNAPWGLANVVAGPQSGYAWEFDHAAYLSQAGTATDKLRAAIKIGPWNRVRYPGSQISSDQPGLISNVLGQAGRDASLMGVLPSTIPANATAVRFAIGQLELGRPEYSAVKVRVTTPPASGSCPIIYADAFGGDAGGSDGGKDHIWRYFDPTVVSLSPCTLLQKVASAAIVAPNQNFYYDIVFANNGNVALPNVVLTDTLPTGVVHVSATPTPTSIAAPNYRWAVGTVQPGQVITIRQNVRATGTGTLFNTVTATSDNAVIGVAQDSVEVGQRAILDKRKSVNVSTAAPGETVIYSLVIENIGSGNSGTPIRVREFLPPGFTFVQLINAELNNASIGSTAITVDATKPSEPLFTVTQSLKAGNTLKINFSARIGATVSLGTYYNSFQVEYEGKVVPPIQEAPVTVGGGKIGDTVFRDWNGDGDQDLGEGGIQGVTVSLYRDADSNGSYETLVGTQTTDANGLYLFTGLPAGNYQVQVPAPGSGGVPAGYILTADPNGGALTTSFNIALAHEQQFFTADWGFRPAGTGSIGDQVFEDLNKNGVWNAGEPGIPNVTVDLFFDANDNGSIDSGEASVATQVTNGSGVYSFTGLNTSHNYIARVNTLDPDINTYFTNLYGAAANQLTSTNPHIISSGFTAYTTADFGFWRDVPAAIGDQVFVDSNLNGTFDSGDVPMGNITVNLFAADGTTLLATTVSDPLGIYTFGGLPAGSYVVRVATADPDVPAGHTATVASYNVTLAAGDQFLTADFPFVAVFNKSVNLASAIPGNLLTYSLYPYWPGPSLLTNAKITDLVPVGTTFSAVGQGGIFGTAPITSTLGIPGSHPGSSGSATATLTATKDTYLNSGAVTLNYGDSTSLIENRGGGDTLGTRQVLVQFDLTAIPAGATITGAQFLLTKSSTNNPGVSFQIYPLLKAWDEGTLNGTAGAASFNLRTAPSTYWGGGTTAFDKIAPSADFGSLLAQVTVGAANTYTWSGTALTTQVTNWYTTPATNYGLVMGCNDSGTDDTVWNSSENTGTKPRLVVNYTATASPATTTAITVTPSSVTDNGSGVNVTVSMTVTATGAVSNITAPTNLTVIPGALGATATRVSGPTNSPASIGAGGGSATFTWVYNVVKGTAADQVKFSGAATGTGATFGSATSNGVVVNIPSPSDTLVTWNLGSNVAAVNGSAPGGAALNQWASTVVGFSSQFSTTNWSAAQALGPPNTNACGDIETAWAPLGNGTGAEFLHVGYSTPVYATGVVVRETFNSGFVTAITLYEPNGTAHSITIPADTTACPGLFTVNFPQTAYLVSQIRIATAKSGWEEIDAVQLLGVEQGSPTTTAMSVLPALVTDSGAGVNVSVSMTVTSPGAVTNITAPVNLTVAGTNSASATKVSGPTNSPASIGAGGSATFTWVYKVTAGTIPGQVTFSGTPTGTGATFGAATSNGVIVTPPLTMQVQIISPNPGVPLIENTAEFYNGPNFIAQDNAITSLSASIGDFVWLDTDRDGLQDVGEFGIGGVTVNVYSANGSTLIGSAVTDGSGFYRVYGLTAGDYLVSYDLSTAPEGYFGTTPPSLAVNLATNSTQYNTADFGLNVLPPGTGSIGDFVWIDANNDGIQDVGELPIPNVNITLERFVNGNWVVIGTTTTDENGGYLFSGLSASNYRLTVDTTSQVSSPYAQGTFNLGSVMAPTFDRDGTGTPHVALVTLATSSTVVTNADFGYNWSGSIGDLVWWDYDTDGTQDEAPIVGIPNARVQLYFDSDFDGVLDRILGDYEILRVFSDASGNYLIPNLPPGNYFVDVYEDSITTGGIRDVVPTTDDLVPVNLTPVNKNVTTADFGYFQGARVEALIFWDANHDGFRAPEEQLLTGITVTLTGTDNLGNPITRSADTDGSGNVVFLVPEGDYNISYDLADRDSLYPALDSQTTPVSFDFEATAGDDGVRFFEFGVDNAGTIGDTIFADIDENGAQSNSEPGLADVTVNLYYDLNGDGVIDPEDSLLDIAVTDATGKYAFIGLADTTGLSKYLVQVLPETLPSDYVDVPTAFPVGANTINSIYITSLTGGQTINIVDFGYPLNPIIAESVFTISGTTYNDNGAGGGTASNGLLEVSETRFQNVRIEIVVDPPGVDTPPVTYIVFTDVNGFYSLDGIPLNSDVSITVIEATLPSTALVQTGDPNGATLSNEWLISGISANNSNLNFGYIEDLGSIAGTVVRGDGDGLAEVGETSFNNITVTLRAAGPDGILGTADDVITNTTTNSAGDYLFTGLFPGPYEITTTVASGYFALADRDGFNPNSINVTLSLGQDVIDRDFEYEASTLAGTVRTDTNGNGSFDSGEPAISGVTVFLDLDGDGAFDAGEPTTTTAINGTYSFGPIPSGTYSVRINPATLPVGSTGSYDYDGIVSLHLATVVVGVNQNITGVDFGYYQPGSIAGNVSIDTTGNGAGDTAQSGVTVTLKDGLGNDIDSDPNTSGIQPTEVMTNASGNYSFNNLPPGNYRVTQTVPSGFSAIDDADDGDFTVIGNLTPITITSGLSITDRDFVNSEFVTIGDFVFNDANANGQQDGGELGLAGVTVSLFRPGFGADGITGNTDDTLAITTQVTTSTGAYSFGSLITGDYQIGFSALSGYTRTLTNVGADETDSDADPATGLTSTFTMAAGATNNTIDAGYYAPVTIGNFVFNDANANGQQDGGELGLAGVTVSLLRPGFGPDGLSGTSDDADAITSQVTGSDGAYSFSGLPPGTYQVGFSTLSGYSRTLADQGADTSDSDANAGTGLTTTFAVAAGTTNNTIDAGYYAPVTIGNFVFNDADADGQQDVGELGLAGVTVSLFRPSFGPDGLSGTSDDADAITSQVTVSDGVYSFSGLPPGTYQVGFSSLAGYTRTLADVGNDATDSDADRTTGLTATFAVAAGTTINTIDAGFSQLGDLAITKDVNQPTQAVGSQVVFTLTAANLGVVNATGVEVEDALPAGYTFVSASPNGAYDPLTDIWTIGSFASGANAVLTITVTVNATGPYLNTATISGDQFETTLANNSDSAEVTPLMVGSIAGKVWEDTDNDGEGDTPIQFVILRLLDSSGNPVLDENDVPITTQTDVDGNYTFAFLPPGTYRVAEDQPLDYTSLKDSDGGNPDLIGAIAVVVGEQNSGNNFVEMRSCPHTWADWKQLHPDELPAGNPDQDRYDNFAEFAFAMPYDSGVGGEHLGSTAWIIQPYAGANPALVGTIEGVFVRPKGAVQNVLYTLQYAAVLGSSTTWTTIPFTPTPADIVDNGDCTETVTIRDLQTLTGLEEPAIKEGFVRIKAELDETNDSIIDYTSLTEVEGWTITPFAICCSTYNNPYQRECAFTGTVTAVNGQNLVFAANGLLADLFSGASYFVEIASGPLAGHRFDVTGSSANAITIATDLTENLNISAPPFNTLAGPAPAGLVGATVTVHRHWTLNQLFPPASFGAHTLQDEADQIQVQVGGNWTIYWLYANGGSPIWLDLAVTSAVDQGATILPPGQGVFFNNRTAATSLMSYGEVRQNRFVRPLFSGYNLVGGGYPVTASPALRSMDNTSFTGTTSLITADSILIWNNDNTAVNTNNYTTRWLLNATLPYKRWVRVGDSSAAAQDNNLIFPGDRAAFLRRANNNATYSYPAPWAP